MSKKTKIILRYPKYQNIIDQYLSLDEFEEKAVETMRSKRVTVTTFCNYLGDQGIESINLCLQKHVVGFMENISSLSTSVYDLLNCLILDYTNCPKTAQFYAQNGSLISPEYSGDITLSNYFVKFF